MQVDDEGERFARWASTELAMLVCGRARKGDDLGGLAPVLPAFARVKHLKSPPLASGDAQNTVNDDLKLNGSSKEPCAP
jgi:hypothetical protein